MPINSLEFAEKFTGVLDKELTEKSQVGFMADNAFRAHFVGAKTVKIPKVNMSALGDYDRNTGFVKGAVSVTNSIYELTQDRGRSFTIDREDMDETGVAELAGSTLTEFVRNKVTEETDAYVLSKLSGIAISKNQTLSITDYPLATKAFAAFLDLEVKIREKVGANQELVCFIPWTGYNKFINSTEISKMIRNDEFKQGDVSLKVSKINEITLIPVSSEKMYTAYEFYDGTTDGQEEGGFKKMSNASLVSMLMLPKSAASLVKKSEKIRTFTPDQNLDMDAYKFDYRLYYDVFVKDSMLETIWILK